MYGSGPLVREALVRAKPWQRLLIAAAMVAGGIVLVLLGRDAGGLLSVAGLFLLWRMLRYRVGRGHAASRPPVEEVQA